MYVVRVESVIDPSEFGLLTMAVIGVRADGDVRLLPTPLARG